MKATYRIEENRQYNSREIYFTGKPAAETREALKSLKMRWNPKKMCWYGFAEESEIISAIQGAEPATVLTDGYMGGGAIYGSKSGLGLYGSDLAKALRNDFKNAGIKGVTIKQGRGGYTDSFTITITIERPDLKEGYEASNNELYKDLSNYGVQTSNKCYHWRDLADESGAIDTCSKEWQDFKTEVAEYTINRYAKPQELNHYHLEWYAEFTEAFAAKVQAIKNIILAYYWDESNSMVDYFNTSFYYDLRTKPGKSWETLKEVS